jgi:hypothetical protein
MDNNYYRLIVFCFEIWQKRIWILKISFASRFVFLGIIYGRARRGEKKLEITLEAD